ncbi:MAG: stage II sporulation protein D [Romboutsia sp.]|uniref:stage II sporulation protein D n=1 Tax=Romboutsia sp. TaxID=1965302 RepID=UPI003F3C2A80
MKNPLAILITIVACSISIPILISIVSYDGIEATASVKEQTIEEIKPTLESRDKVKEIINYETINKKSPTISVYNHNIGKNQQLDMEEYLCGVLAGEMSAEFNLEALKAQAVAARTFVMYKEGKGKQSKHKNAIVCTDFRHCQEYKSYDELKKKNGEEWMKNSYSKIQQAVQETKGHIIVYNDEPILTLYFSTSSGKTENSEEVFSAAYPYLKSVDSPYDKDYSPKYVSTLKITNQDFVKAFNSAYSDIQLSENDLNSQIEILDRSDGGSVEIIKIGNKKIKGTDVRQILSLNSANFDIEFKEDYLDIVIKGYGHGVGMSQWGAEGMAEEGYQYYEILSHYYTGTKIKDLY